MELSLFLRRKITKIKRDTASNKRKKCKCLHFFYKGNAPSLIAPLFCLLLQIDGVDNGREGLSALEIVGGGRGRMGKLGLQKAPKMGVMRGAGKRTALGIPS